MFRKLSDLTPPLTVQAGRVIVDGNGRFVCRLDRGDNDREYDRLTPVAADSLAHTIADLLTEAVWSGKVPDFIPPHLTLVPKDEI